MFSDASYLRIARPQDLEKPGERRLFRFFEMLPGMLAWATFLAIVLASRFWPDTTAVCLIMFILFWFLRTLYFLLHLVAGYRQTRANQKIDWELKLESLSFPRQTLPALPSWRDLWHLIILPTFNEPYEVLRDSVQSLRASGYPAERMIVVAAFE